MRKNLAALFATIGVLILGAYSAGLFTAEDTERESCVICRANRSSGSRYGFGFEKVEDTAFTAWYREKMDREHGADGGSPHDWQVSGCPVYVAPGVANLEATCPSIAPVLLLKPETQLTALKAAPDNVTRRAIIESLNTRNRRAAMERVKLLVEYVYVYREKTTWSAWWHRNGSSFGLKPSGRPLALR